MSPEPATASGPWPVLGMNERRILGVLVEKAKTTPDVYPLSINALVSGCNQKSNREPILNLTDDDVEDTLDALQKQGLVMKVTGGRVVRWRHNLYDAWQLDKPDIAVMAELLLRGPQTEGELRTRASRMEAIDDLDALRAILRPLVQRNLVVYLTPEDRRGAVLTHGFHDPAELRHLRGRHAAEPAAAAIPAAPAAPSRADQALPALEAGLAEARNEIRILNDLVARLREEMAGLQADLQNLKQSLGA
jgi:uncharacterized protein YceH (UPF0502 family)